MNEVMTWGDYFAWRFGFAAVCFALAFIVWLLRTPRSGP